MDNENTERWAEGYAIYVCFSTFDPSLLERIKDTLKAASASLNADGIGILAWKSSAMLSLRGSPEIVGIELNVAHCSAPHVINSAECTCPNDEYHRRIHGEDQP